MGKLTLENNAEKLPAGNKYDRIIICNKCFEDNDGSCIHDLEGVDDNLYICKELENRLYKRALRYYASPTSWTCARHEGITCLINEEDRIDRFHQGAGILKYGGKLATEVLASFGASHESLEHKTIEEEFMTLRSEVGRAYLILKNRGVPKKRAHSLGNGILVLSDRLCKEIRSLEFTIDKLKSDLEDEKRLNGLIKLKQDFMGLSDEDRKYVMRVCSDLVAIKRAKDKK